jgi:hypothetical protein
MSLPQLTLLQRMGPALGLSALATASFASRMSLKTVSATLVEAPEEKSPPQHQSCGNSTSQLR